MSLIYMYHVVNMSGLHIVLFFLVVKPMSFYNYTFCMGMDHPVQVQYVVFKQNYLSGLA